MRAQHEPKAIQGKLNKKRAGEKKGENNGVYLQNIRLCLIRNRKRKRLSRNPNAEIKQIQLLTQPFLIPI
jgi:hypothetical protein